MMARKPREESEESASDRGHRARQAKADLERARETKALRESIAKAQQGARAKAQAAERAEKQAAERARTQRAIDASRAERLRKFRDDDRKRDR